MSFLEIFVLGIFGYFVGSIPWGILVPRYLGRGDPRQVGSQNIGASNVFRLAGFLPAFLVFLGDFLKGYLLVLFVFHRSMESGEVFARYVAEWSGFCAVLGHLFPVWLLGRGGKGVAVSFGIMTVLFGKITFVMMAIWGCVWWVKRYASLASLVSFSVGIGILCLSYPWKEKIFLGSVLILIFWSHRHNLVRLFMNMENKIEKGKKA